MIQVYTYLVLSLIIIAVLVPVLVFKVSHAQGKVYTFKARPLNDSSYLSKFYQTKFRSVEEINQYIIDLVTAYSFFCELNQIGHTSQKGIYKGHPIYVLKISSGFPKPIVLIIGGVYANDWTSVTSILYVANQLLANCSRAGLLITTYDWHFIPLLNPDGYSYSQSKPAAMYWIKNIARWSMDYMGVNLDCNFGVGWKRLFNFHEDTYPGINAFSEVETRALRDYVNRISKYVEMAIIFKSPPDSHTRESTITFPWSYTSTRPRTWVLMEYLGVAAAFAANATTGTKYRVIQSGRLATDQYGRIDDWLLGKSGIHVVLTVQRRFMAELTADPYDSITKVGSEMFAIVNASSTSMFYLPISYRKTHKHIDINEVINIGGTRVRRPAPALSKKKKTSERY